MTNSDCFAQFTGASLPYPLPADCTFTLWRWYQWLTYRDFIQNTTFSVEYWHWQQSGRTSLSSESLKLLGNDEIVMPDNFREYQQPITEHEKKLIYELLDTIFDSPMTAGIEVAVKIGFACVPTTGLSWYEQKGDELIFVSATLVKVETGYQFKLDKQ